MDLLEVSLTVVMQLVVERHTELQPYLTARSEATSEKTIQSKIINEAVAVDK
jgi:hypothetical protein